jgi:hypothetical protein
MRHWEIKATGRGVFPLDMLRYGQLHPLDAESVEAIREPARYNLRRTVRLGLLASNDAVLPGIIARFESFNWKAEAIKL